MDGRIGRFPVALSLILPSFIRNVPVATLSWEALDSVDGRRDPPGFDMVVPPGLTMREVGEPVVDCELCLRGIIGRLLDTAVAKTIFLFVGTPAFPPPAGERCRGGSISALVTIAVVVEDARGFDEGFGGGGISFEGEGWSSIADEAS